MHYGKPTEGIWSCLKRSALANLAVTSYAHLLQVIKHGLKKIQYQPGLIDGCLAGTGLSLKPDGTCREQANLNSLNWDFGRS